MNAVDEYDWTALYGAAQYGHIDVVKALIEVGADVNYSDCDGNTPLTRAVANGHADIVKALIEAGAK